MGARDGAFGMEPVGLLGGRVFAGAFRQLPIASAYNTNIFKGDVVRLVTGGTIERLGVTAAGMPVGIFMGVSYTDATLGFVQRNYWPANQVATDAYAYVCDDPWAVFKIQSDETLSATAIGLNFSMINGTGSTATGMSANEIDGSTENTTNTFPLRVIDFLDRDEIDSDFPIMLVTWNHGLAAIASSSGHQYLMALGHDAT